MRKLNVVFFIVFLLFQCMTPTSFVAAKSDYDIVIKGGKIVNPATEHELSDYYIGIRGSKIERITKEPLTGIQEIDATGLIISPGFIDLVSYDPNSVGIELKVHDGVTSNLAMHGGTENAAVWYDSWGNNGVLTNFGASSFITRLRWPIVGQDIFAEMTDEDDIEQLVQAVTENVKAGALGISFSLEYIPGVKYELEPLLELAAEYDLPTFYHLRYSDEEKGLEGIQEVIDLGKKTGAAIHIMHINSTGGTFVMDEALKMIDEAKESGLDITTDFYPYDFWATYLGSARFLPGWEDRFKITYENLQIAGTDEKITEETFAHYRSQNTLVAALGSMPEDELHMLLKHSDTMIGSDTIIEPHFNNHPRGAGTYSRLFGKYVREEQVLSMMDAVKKASYYPAKRMESSALAMRNKGRIEVGADADLTIFDPETITDQSTVKDTAAPSKGIEYVIINGVITKDPSGLIKGVSPGQPIMSYLVEEVPEDHSLSYEITIDNNSKEQLDNIYDINGELFLPIYETFNLLNFNINDQKDGKIIIDEFLNFEIGQRSAQVYDTTVELIEEPMLYKENVYFALADLQKVLERKYTIEEIDEYILQFETIKEEEGENIDDRDAIETNANMNEDSDNIKNPTNYMTPIISGITVLLALFILIKIGKRFRK